MDDKNKDEKEKDEAFDDPSLDIFGTLDEILQTKDTEFRTIRKAWGGRPCRVGSLTAGQMITFLENNDKPELKRQNGLMLIAFSLVNKEGTRLVNPDDGDAVKRSIESLKKKDSKVNGEVVEQILLLNGLNKKDALKIAKDVAKND
jgi:hypothetical protein